MEYRGHRIACKSNFSSIPTDHNKYILVNDCITSVDEDDDVFMRVLERQHTIKFDMEKWKNLHAEAKMNLKDWRASLPREWANHFYEVIKHTSNTVLQYFQSTWY